MPELTELFRQAVARVENPYTAALAADPLLAERLAAACARGHAAFPELKVSDEAFVDHLARCLGRSDELMPPLEDLALEDLYLACACLLGTLGALATFDAHCGPRIRAGLAGLSDHDIDRDEIEQQLHIRLLTEAENVPPRLLGYLGLGPLAGWARVAALRLALSAMRSNQTETSARERSAVEAAFDWKDPAIVLLKQRYRADFQQALEDALKVISDRHRLLLRMSLVNGMSTRSIGKVFNVDHSTAARWLTDARQEVGGHVQRLLRERLKLTSSEVESIATLMTSQLDLSMSVLLQP